MPLFGKIVRTLQFLRYGPTRLDEALARVASLEQRAAADRAFALANLTELHQQHAAFQQALAGVQQALAGMQQALASARQDLVRETGWTRDQLSALGAALDRMQLPAVRDGAPVAGISVSAAAAEESFYPALEQQFRGSPADVRARLDVYRPWVTSLPEGAVGDLGCGRGEWMELLQDWGVTARGVDLNVINVQQMRARGLAADHGDAVQWLQSQPDASLAGLTSFHVVEHLPFAVLLRLVQEARRALAPGGRLILETPNPENLGVATHTFWLDPTHLRPLPAALLELVMRHAGLELEATLRLNPPEGDGADIADPTLRALMMQGRDYAVIARKPHESTLGRPELTQPPRGAGAARRPGGALDTKAIQ